MKWHVCLTLTIASAWLSACAGDPCPGGSYEGLIILSPTGISGRFGPLGNEKELPYADRPVAHCTSIASILVYESAKIRSDDFASASTIGDIGSESFNEGDWQQTIDGFDQVEHLGALGYPASDVTGFNNVVAMDYLGTGGDFSGFQKLEDLGALVGGRSTAGLAHLKHLGSARFGAGTSSLELPALEEVEGDLTLDGTRLSSFSLPSLTYVGGDMRIAGNPGIAVWGGLANNARVDGDVTIAQNYAVTNEQILNWIASSAMYVGGILLVCGNGSVGPDNCPQPGGTP